MDVFQQQIHATAIALQCNRPIYLIGSPGIGKTAVVGAILRSIGKMVGYEPPNVTLMLALKDPQEIGGYHVMTPRGLVVEPPEYFKRLSQEVVGDKIGALIFDEMNQGAPMTMAASMRILHEGRVGEDCVLGRNIARIATMNPPEEGCSAFNLAAPVANRGIHLNFTHSVTTWCEGIIAGFQDPIVPKLPEGWTNFIPGARALTASFIRVKPTLLLQVPKDEEKAGGAWPSPRSWDMLATIMAACDACGASDDIKARLMAGCVGEGPALEVLTYARELDLPDPEEVLKDPKRLKLPERSDRQYAVLSSVAAVVLNKNTKARWKAAVHLMCEANKQCPDIAAQVVKVLCLNKPSGAELPEELEVFADILVAAGVL